MGKTVIDQLVVTLGLDSTDYKKGKAAADAAQQKLKQTALADAQATETAGKKTGKTVSALGKERKRQATDEQKRTKQADQDRKRSTDLEKKSNDGLLSRLKNIGIAAGAAVLGFKTLEGAIAAYAATSGNLANLGRLAPTVGMSPGGLNILGNAYKQVGGTQADANSDAGKIAAAQFSWQMHQPDAFAGFARNLGVGLFDNKGKERDKVAILTDIGKALRTQTHDVQAQAMYARQMGLSEASIQLFIVDQAKTRKQILADAIKTNAVTAQETKNAIALSTAWAKVKNRAQGFRDTIVGKTDADLATTLNKVTDPKLSFLQKSEAVIIGAMGGYLPNTGLQYLPAFIAADKANGLPLGTTAGIAARESSFDPNAVNKKSGARGIMQLNPKFFPNAGKNTTADINAGAKEYARLLKHYHGNSTEALEAYNWGEGNVDKFRKGIIKRMPAETRAYAPAVLSHMPGAAGAAATVRHVPSAASAPAAGATPPTASTINNSVEIDNLVVNTQAKDANGIAASLPDALRRKGIIASANTGMS
jgi:soluble lytic murein transglycosylase-like protein